MQYTALKSCCLQFTEKNIYCHYCQNSQFHKQPTCMLITQIVFFSLDEQRKHKLKKKKQNKWECSLVHFSLCQLQTLITKPPKPLQKLRKWSPCCFNPVASQPMDEARRSEWHHLCTQLLYTALAIGTIWCPSQALPS